MLSHLLGNILQFQKLCCTIWQPASKMAPGILTSGYSCTCQVTTQNYQGWYVGQQDATQVSTYYFQSQGIKDTSSSALFTCRSCALEEASAAPKTLPYGEASWGKEPRPLANSQPPVRKPSGKQSLQSPVKPSHDCIPANISTAAS